MTDRDWSLLVARLREQQAVFSSWEPAEPAPSAPRCEFSRHRTLAHLRAAQGTWLQVVERFLKKPGANVVLLHPWRLFESEHYDLMSWDEHVAAFQTDREKWMSIIEDPRTDRTVGGKFNRNARSVESLTEVLANHERHHIKVLRDTAV